MPIIGTIAGASARGYGGLRSFASALFGSTNWITGINSANSSNINATAYGYVSEDLKYAVFGLGGAGTAPSNNPAFILQDSTGSVLLQKGFSDSSNTSATNSFVDSSGNVYFGYQENKVLKMDKTGTVLWAKQYDRAYANIYSLSADETILQASIINSEQDRPVGILTSDGTIAWAKSQSNYATNALAWGGAGSTMFLYTGYERNGQNIGWARSVNQLTGVQNYTVYISASSGQVGISAFGDTSDNGYWGGYDNSGSWFNKVNSSGSLQWSKTIGSTQQFPKFGGVDSSGNVYWGHNDGTKHYIIKFNSSGTIQWQRSIVGSAGTSNSGQIQVIDNNNLYCVFSASDGTRVNGYVAILPTDGSKTGTYTVNGKTIVYAASSLSTGNSGYTLSTDYSYAAGSASGTTYTPTVVTNTNSTAVTII